MFFPIRDSSESLGDKGKCWLGFQGKQCSVSELLPRRRDLTFKKKGERACGSSCGMLAVAVVDGSERLKNINEVNT